MPRCSGVPEPGQNGVNRTAGPKEARSAPARVAATPGGGTSGGCPFLGGSKLSAQDKGPCQVGRKWGAARVDDLSRGEAPRPSLCTRQAAIWPLGVKCAGTTSQSRGSSHPQRQAASSFQDR